MSETRTLSERLLSEIFENSNSVEAEKNFLLRFSVFNYEVGLEEIQALMSIDHLEDLIQSLQDKLMLKRSVQGKYSMHSLIREFYYTKNSNQDKLFIHSAAADYYLSQREYGLNLSLEEKIFFHLSASKDFIRIENSIITLGGSMILAGHLYLL